MSKFDCNFNESFDNLITEYSLASSANKIMLTELPKIDGKSLINKINIIIYAITICDQKIR
jgi:hypothetical protein